MRENRQLPVWQRAILERIGIDDPFLALGGNSPQAMRIAVRLREEFNIKISLEEIFATPTVAEMALIVTAHLAADDVDNESEATSHV